MNLEEIFSEDSRVEEVYHYAKEKYQKEDLEQHNWEHIVGNLYRALKIAETEENVNYAILTISVLFHDIGVTEGEYRNHEENSIKIAERELPDVGFSDEEVESIVHCLETVGEEEDSQTIEAKICSDADKLVKSGFASVFNFFRVQKELGRPLEEFSSSTSRYERLGEIGFYTDKAEEISNDGFKERVEFMKKFHEKLKERPDFTATEEDLKNL
ncbi:MAG: HD superfamily phosphodiesterase [Candidatus Nanohaloarchaea archaeon]|jgi:HD superfamily phosphodiesterase